jgi:DNA-binding HxlR family transcriptional regulator
MKTEDCLVRLTADVIGGKWKLLILFYLNSGTRRFNELRRLIRGATQDADRATATARSR